MPFPKGKSPNPGGKPGPNWKPPGPENPSGTARQLSHLKALIYGHALTKVRPGPLDKLAYGSKEIIPANERRLSLALTRLYREDPKAYLDIICKVLPKDINIEGDFTHHLQSWNAILTYASKTTPNPISLDGRNGGDPGLVGSPAEDGPGCDGSASRTATAKQLPVLDAVVVSPEQAEEIKSRTSRGTVRRPTTRTTKSGRKGRADLTRVTRPRPAGSPQKKVRS